MQVVNVIRGRLMNWVASCKSRYTKFVVTNPSLIPRKPTRIGPQYFLYRKSAQSDYLRNGLKVNEVEDR